LFSGLLFRQTENSRKFREFIYQVCLTKGSRKYGKFAFIYQGGSLYLWLPFFVLKVIKVDSKRILYQAPRPIVLIYDPGDGPAGMPKLSFGAGAGKVLQSYVFSYSVNDPKGAFSLTFYPDDDNGLYKDKSIFDLIEEMDIVRIFEQIDEKGSYPYATFTGVIREKRLIVRKNGDELKRSIAVTGHSVAGLVHEFRISLDTQAMAITDQIANSKQIEMELTTKLLRSDNKPIKAAEAIDIIWKGFLDLSSQYGKLSNPKVAGIIKTWIGENPFDIDDSSFFYPIGSAFYGQNTKSFYDVIESLIPRPVYEIFPFIDGEDGYKTKIKIRISPFDADPWKGLNPKDRKIDPVLLKTFDVEQSDEEVYTVFFSYLDGYPIQQDKALMLAGMRLKGMPEVVLDEEKFGIYGFRPLYLSFHGYYKSPEDDTTTADELTRLNGKLKEWFGNLEKMYTGNITMSTDISKEMPCAGEKIPFLGGEFYVVSTEHRWNYGGNPETSLAISRGGDYSGGSFEELKDVAKRYQELKDDVEWKT
jgi:hypothetical protein